MPPDGAPNVCQWYNQTMAFRHFVAFTGKTESAAHIKPLHWYIACRLVLEGGFHPDDITPRPPFQVRYKNGEHLLSFDPASARGSERTILGGLKTKSVDVVVTRNGIGPVMAVSCKGTTKSFRNLTNRMEETVGECTNLHITYPAMVVGYFSVLKGNRAVAIEATTAIKSPEVLERAMAKDDLAFRTEQEPVERIVRFHAALREMTGRRGIRNDVSRYEAMTIVLLEAEETKVGDAFAHFPPEGSPIRLENFFSTLYARYDERFVFGAPKLKKTTKRLEWSESSPIFARPKPASDPELDYEARIASGPEIDEPEDDED